MSLTTKQMDIIDRNIKAFVANFGEPRLERSVGGGIYVFYPADADSFIQYCPNIDYLDGWLYGVVQGVNRGEFKKEV